MSQAAVKSFVAEVGSVSHHYLNKQNIIADASLKVQCGKFALLYVFYVGKS